MFHNFILLSSVFDVIDKKIASWARDLNISISRLEYIRDLISYKDKYPIKDFTLISMGSDPDVVVRLKQFNIVNQAAKQTFLERLDIYISQQKSLIAPPKISLDPEAYSKALCLAISPLKDVLINFVNLGGTVWVILGVITLGGALKDKNSPNLQAGLWQIVSGSVVIVLAKFFTETPDYTVLLPEISRYIGIGGGLWLVWGVIFLAGALKDKTGPALQSGIWQMVGGGLIMASAKMLASVKV